MREIRKILTEMLTPIIEEAVFNAIFKTNSFKSESEEDVMMNMEEAAKFLQISKVTLHKIKRNGNLKYYRVGRKILFSRKEILNFINT